MCLAVALTAPLAMLAHLNLRAVLATDVEGRLQVSDYLAVRFGVSGPGPGGDGGPRLGIWRIAGNGRGHLPLRPRPTSTH